MTSKNSNFNRIILSFMSIFFFSQFYKSFGDSFMIPRFRDLGLPIERIGMITALGFLSGIVGQIVTGFLITKYGRVKRIYTTTIVIVTFCISIVYSNINLPIAVLVMFQGIIGLSLNTIVGILDTWVMGYNEEVAQKYGVIRSFTSFGWVVSCLILVPFINTYSYIVLPVSALIFIPIIFSITRTLEDSTPRNNEMKWSDIKNLLEYKPYLYTVLIFFLAFILITGELTLITLKLSTMGSSSHFGYFYAALGMSEIPFMIFFHKLTSKIRVPYFLLLGVIGYTVRLILYSQASSTTEIFLIACTMGSFSFPPILLASRYLIKETVPEKYHAIGMMLGIALSWGATGIFSASLVSTLIYNIGISNTYTVYIVYAIIVFIVSSIFVNYYLKQREVLKS